MNLASVENFFKKPDLGLLLLRTSVGAIMFMHGLPKYLGGAGTLRRVGEAMAVYGIDFAPVMWGFLAATVEVVGGVLLILGVLFRSAAALMTFVLLTAVLTSMPGSPSLNNFGDYAHPLAMLCASLGLLFTGPGNWSIQKS